MLYLVHSEGLGIPEPRIQSVVKFHSDCSRCKSGQDCSNGCRESCVTDRSDVIEQEPDSALCAKSNAIVGMPELVARHND